MLVFRGVLFSSLNVLAPLAEESVGKLDRGHLISTHFGEIISKQLPMYGKFEGFPL